MVTPSLSIRSGWTTAFPSTGFGRPIRSNCTLSSASGSTTTKRKLRSSSRSRTPAHSRNPGRARSISNPATATGPDNGWNPFARKIPRITSATRNEMRFRSRPPTGRISNRNSRCLPRVWRKYGSADCLALFHFRRRRPGHDCFHIGEKTNTGRSSRSARFCFCLKCGLCPAGGADLGQTKQLINLGDGVRSQRYVGGTRQLLPRGSDRICLSRTGQRKRRLHLLLIRSEHAHDRIGVRVRERLSIGVRVIQPAQNVCRSEEHTFELQSHVNLVC